MITSILFLLAAAASGPPPYAESLACAAYTQASSQLADETGDRQAAATAFDAAMYWALVTMDAARRDGMTAKAAEVDQVTERDRLKPLLTAADPGAKAALADCLRRVPDLKG